MFLTQGYPSRLQLIIVFHTKFLNPKDFYHVLLLIHEIVVNPCRVEEAGHVLAVLGHDKLDGVLVFLQGGPQFLVLVLQLPDMAILLLDA